MLITSILVSVSQCICVSKHQVELLKYIKFLLSKNTLIKLWGKGHEKCDIQVIYANFYIKQIFKIHSNNTLTMRQNFRNQDYPGKQCCISVFPSLPSILFNSLNPNSYIYYLGNFEESQPLDFELLHIHLAC